MGGYSGGGGGHGHFLHALLWRMIKLEYVRLPARPHFLGLGVVPFLGGISMSPWHDDPPVPIEIGPALTPPPHGITLLSHSTDPVNGPPTSSGVVRAA